MHYLWLLWSYYETIINRLFWIFWNIRILFMRLGTSTRTTLKRETSHLLKVFDISNSLDLSVSKNIWHCSEIGRFLLYESLLVSRKRRYNAKRKKVKRRNNALFAELRLLKRRNNAFKLFFSTQFDTNRFSYFFCLIYF